MAKLATFYDHIKDIARQESMSLTEAMGEVKACGIESLEISQNNLLGREDEVGHELAYAGLGISSIPAYFNFGRDGDVDKQSEPTLEAARFLGAGKMLVIPGFFAPEDDETERARQMEQIAQCINRLADKAAGYGVSLIMEDFDNALSPCATVEQLRFFADRCPGLSVCFDTGNFRFSAQNELEAYEALKDRVGHVHLKDRAFSSLNGEPPLKAVDGKEIFPCPVGSGGLDIAGVISRLKRDGYDGVYTIEHYGAAKALEYVKQSAQWVKEQLKTI